MQNSSCKKDFFRKHVSEDVKILKYPKFAKLSGNRPVKTFIMYMEHSKIYYKELEMTSKIMQHLAFVGKQCKIFGPWYPNEIKWLKVGAKFEKDTFSAARMNADTRVGFKLGNKYLVKAYFTFGQRTVEPGTAHVYQTKNVPLLLFLHEGHGSKENKLFPFANMLKYNRSILLADTCYRIPPGTTYMIFSTQKNFFSLDIVKESYQIPFAYKDPVKNRVFKLDMIYDKMCPTPFVEDEEEQNMKEVEDLEEEDEGMEEGGEKQERRHDLSEYFVDEPFKQPGEPLNQIRTIYYERPCGEGSSAEPTSAEFQMYNVHHQNTMMNSFVSQPNAYLPTVMHGMTTAQLVQQSFLPAMMNGTTQFIQQPDVYTPGAMNEKPTERYDTSLPAVQNEIPQSAQQQQQPETNARCNPSSETRNPSLNGTQVNSPAGCLTIPRPLPVLEKNVIINAPDFLNTYQKLASKRYGDPTDGFKIIEDDLDCIALPWDLSIKNNPKTTQNEEEGVPMDLTAKNNSSETDNLTAENNSSETDDLTAENNSSETVMEGQELPVPMEMTAENNSAEDDIDLNFSDEFMENIMSVPMDPDTVRDEMNDLMSPLLLHTFGDIN